MPALASDPGSLAAPRGQADDREGVPDVRAVGWQFARRWFIRLALVTLALALLAVALPLVAPADRMLFDVVNGWGYGPDWVFELLDPHERFYRGLLLLAIIAAFWLRGPWTALGVASTLMCAATASYLLLEAIALLTDRPRPQAVFDDILKPPGADWAQASYPSGHVTVTTALAAGMGMALPALRWPMALVVAVVAWSRIAFGAHFPLDVLGGAVLGYASAAFSVALVAGSGLLPPPPPHARPSADARESGDQQRGKPNPGARDEAPVRAER